MPGLEHLVQIALPEDDANHLLGRDAGRKYRRQHRAGRKPHEQIEIAEAERLGAPAFELAPREDLVERLQAARLVRAARDGAAGEHDRDLTGPKRPHRWVPFLDHGDPPVTDESLLE